METMVKRWQKVAAMASAVRLIERRLEAAEAQGRDPVMLVRLVERLHKQLARERLTWEGVTDA